MSFAFYRRNNTLLFMVGQVTINYQPQSREERQLLEEIIERTKDTAQRGGISRDV